MFSQKILLDDYSILKKISRHYEYVQNEIKCWNDLSEYLRIIIFEAVEVGKW